MRKPYVPPHQMIFIRDVEHKVSYDFDPGESQWFDARAGVGSPGYPAYVEIAEIDPPIELTETEVKAVEQEIMDRLDAEMRDADDAYAESLRD